MRIQKEKTLFIAVDYQEKLLPAISNRKMMLEKSVFLIRCLKELGIPMIQTTQYAKGLGGNDPAVSELIGKGRCFDKITFSIMQNPAVRKFLESGDYKYILIGGAEAHICVLQSVIDLAEAGYVPVLIADCVGSRNGIDCEIALERARQEGAVLTTAEAVVYELMESAKNPHFKKITKLVKEQGE